MRILTTNTLIYSCIRDKSQRPNDIRRIQLKTLKIENRERSKNTYFLIFFQPKDAIGGDGRSNIAVKRIRGRGFIGVEITSKNNTEIFLFSRKNEITYGDIQSKWISIVKDSEGDVLKTISCNKI